MPILKDIIKSLEDNNKVGASLDLEYTEKSLLNLEITNITYDPDKVNSHSAYLCLENEEFPTNFGKYNSYQLAKKAYQKGVRCFISRNALSFSLDCGGVFTIISDNINRLGGFFASIVYHNPFKDIQVIGVTGTKGKTTTSFFINSILSQAKKRTGIIGTVGIFYPSTHESTGFLSNPPATDIFEIGVKMRKEQVEVLIMEITSHGAIFERNSALEFDMILMTNMKSDHLDFHRTLLEYRNAKMLYFERLSSYDNPCIAIFNKDDIHTKEFIQTCHKGKANGYEVLTYGITDKQADLNAQVIKESDQGSLFELYFKGKHIDQINLRLPGLFNVYNGLAAILACQLLGIKHKHIKHVLENSVNVPGRFEIIETKLGFKVVIDYAHTYDSLRNIIESLKKITPKKVIVVFGCGGDRDKTKRPMMGEVASNLADIVIITSDNPRDENPLSIIKDINAGIDDNHLAKVLVIADRKEAILKALKMASKGDMLLVAGKGHERYQLIKGKFNDFDDTKIVNEFLVDLSCEGDTIYDHETTS
ncbi:MAG: UDP-N-acetylmuramoyl-L-alanyl-D-glutamate--2,6-diaminopimelate ligase [SAR324 cluster bacterium]|nr:UDP-N-acetylmuramoyl-L-alanyl-D-glutamate--2,6-diaminopimelate ligase [SAR324 cluster bacterium]